MSVRVSLHVQPMRVNYWGKLRKAGEPFVLPECLIFPNQNENYESIGHEWEPEYKWRRVLVSVDAWIDVQTKTKPPLNMEYVRLKWATLGGLSFSAMAVCSSIEVPYPQFQADSKIRFNLIPA